MMHDQKNIKMNKTVIDFYLSLHNVFVNVNIFILILKLGQRL
jgi:hypothetical protein